MFPIMKFSGIQDHPVLRDVEPLSFMLSLNGPDILKQGGYINLRGCPAFAGLGAPAGLFDGRSFLY